MNIIAKVNMSHIDSEGHDVYKDGQFEMVEGEPGTYVVQIIMGDWCAAALIDKSAFDRSYKP